MRRARRGDCAAYASLLREIAAFLRPIVRARLGAMGFGAQEVEDVVQEALTTIHLKRDTWDEGRPLMPWLRAIARHKTLDAARRLGRMRRRADPRPVEDMADLLPAPAAAVAQADAHAQSLVAGLPARERGVVAALGIEGLSVAAAARRLSISEGAVRVAFHRGLSRLRALVDAADIAPRGDAAG